MAIVHENVKRSFIFKKIDVFDDIFVRKSLYCSDFAAEKVISAGRAVDDLATEERANVVFPRKTDGRCRGRRDLAKDLVRADAVWSRQNRIKIQNVERRAHKMFFLCEIGTCPFRAKLMQKMDNCDVIQLLQNLYTFVN